MRHIFSILALLLAILAAAPAQSQTEGTACMVEPTDQPIAFGDMILCSLSPVGDSDFYRFFSTGNERVHIRVARTQPTNIYFVPCIDLIAPSSSTVTACASSNFNSVVATLNEPGLYAIRVRENANDNSGDYMLLLDRVLPNPTPARLLHSSETLTDRIDPLSDMDLFTFDGVAGSNVAVTASRTDGTNIYFAPCVGVWAPDSALTLTCTGSGSQTVQMTLPVTGSYTVGITDQTVDTPGYYSVTLDCLGGPCAAAQATLTVGAGAPWVDSGVDLSAGDLVAIRATASWQTSAPGRTSGPMGTPDACPSCPVGANRGALLARIGASPSFFAGESFAFAVEAGGSGRLYFQINDDALGDNTGAAIVHVTYSSPPLGVHTGDANPGPLSLGLATPNPFERSTTVRFTLGERAPVSVRVHDVAGRLLRTLLDATPLEVGVHTVTWDGRGDDGSPQAPGIYFLSFKAGAREHTRSAVLLE
jgi:hypothetical protein